MRLWHKALIPYLPRQQLLGQWRECCAIAKNIAEKGTPNHVLVNRIMEYPIEDFYAYSVDVCSEMRVRGYRVNKDTQTKFAEYIEKVDPEAVTFQFIPVWDLFKGWHNNRYLKQCLYNLQEKFDAGAIPKDEWQQITDRFPEYK